MDQNLITRHLVKQAEYKILLARSERLRLVRQSASARTKRSIFHAMRGWIGAALIAAGERMRKTPASTLIPLETTLAD